CSEDQRDAAKSDRQHAERKERKDQADASGNTGKDQSRVCDLDVEAQKPDSSEKERDVGIHDPRQQFLAGGHLETFHGRVSEPKGLGSAIEPLQFPSVEHAQQFRNILRYGVDELIVESLLVRKGSALCDGL